MSQYYILGIAVLVVGTIAKGLARPARFYEFPYFMAAAFGVFILPQAISLARFPGEASPQSVESVLLMTLLCLAACLVGYRIPPNRWIVGHAVIPVDGRRLFQGGVAYVCIAYYFTHLIAQMTFLERGGNLWSGRVTIYNFFAGLIGPGLAICLIHALRTRSQSAWLMSSVAAFMPLVSIIFYGRRETAALVAMTIALTLYFQRRWVVPRLAILGALVVATVLIPGTSQYRSAMRTGDVSRLRQFDFVENFSQFLSRSSILELRNAAMIVEATNVDGDWGCGRAYWDQLVFRFVPAQLVGRDVKSALMFFPARHGADQNMLQGRYKRPIGTTVTGMGDSYHEFWYFGAMFFVLLAVIFKSLWHASLQRDAFFAQVLYIQTTTAAMRAVTHQTVDYLPGLIYNLIFIGIVVYYARVWRPSPTASDARLGTRPI